MDSMKNIPTPQIKKSYDYSKFTLLEANRDVNHKDKILKSIEKIGLIPVPILCNENMQIIDGQGRFCACQELHLPVYYIVVEGLGVEHCIGMNIWQTNWSIHDYIKSYAAQGNQDYCRLLRLMDRHPSIGYKIITSIATNAVGGVDNDTIKKGILKIDISKVSHTDNLCDWLEKVVIPLKPKFKGRFDYFCCALIFAYEHSGANVNRLASIVQDYAYEFSPFATLKDSLAQIERFYNKNLKSNKVYFVTEYDKYLTETYAPYSKRWGRESKFQNF